MALPVRRCHGNIAGFNSRNKQSSIINNFKFQISIFIICIPDESDTGNAVVILLARAAVRSPALGQC